MVLFTRAVSHVVMILAVLRESKRAPALVSAENVEGRALRDGWNTLRRSRTTAPGPMVRCALLMVPCSGVLALLPPRPGYPDQVIGYGGLLAALRLGTTVGVSLMPLLQSRIRLNPVSGVMLGVFALSTLGISQWDSMLLDAAFPVLLRVRLERAERESPVRRAGFRPE